MQLLIKARRHLLNNLQPQYGDALRKTVYRIEGHLHRMRYKNLKEPSNGWPILLGVSLLKSGTHLLDQILTGFSRVSPFTPHIPYVVTTRNASGNYYTPDELIEIIDTFKPLDVIKAHLVASPQVCARVASADFVSYFLYRDLRDIVVSYSYYMKSYAFLRHHVHYKDLPINECIKLTICGLTESRPPVTGIRQMALPFTGWLDQPGVLPLRFEDLVHNRRETLGKIVDHFLRRVDTLSTPREKIIDELQANIDPKRSPTFRSGKTGSWREHFTEEHKRLFKDEAGDLLVKFGYEKNNDW